MCIVELTDCLTTPANYSAGRVLEDPGPERGPRPRDSPRYSRGEFGGVVDPTSTRGQWGFESAENPTKSSRNVVKSGSSGEVLGDSEMPVATGRGKRVLIATGARVNSGVSQAHSLDVDLLRCWV